MEREGRKGVERGYLNEKCQNKCQPAVLLKRKRKKWTENERDRWTEGGKGCRERVFE